MSVPRRGKALAFCVIGMALVAFAVSAHAQENGALYFSPSSGHHEVGDTFAVSVRVNTSGDAINAAEGSIVFDVAKLEVISVSKTSSIFTLWPDEPTFSNSDGTVSFTGGLPSPGYSGADGQIMTINFRAKSATTVKGYTDVVLVSGAILANDGNGTNILQSLGRATFYITPSGITPAPLPNGTAGIGAPVINSSTHPDSTKWYSNSNPAFSWAVPSGVSQLRLVLAQHKNSAPRVLYSPPIDQKSLTDVADGVWYLNAQFGNAQGWGPVGSFTFNIDTQPPASFTVSRVDTADATNPQPQIVFSTTDTLSGIDHYEVQVGSGSWATVSNNLAGQEYTLPLQLPGTRQVSVKAVDRAGNTTAATTSITVAPIAAPTITDTTFSGRGTAGNTILLFADTTQVGQGVVDANGDWHVQSAPLGVGTFIITAYAQDSRGARSNASNAVTVSVKRNILQEILNFMSKFFIGIFQSGTGWFIVSLIFYIIIVSLVIQGFWWLVGWLRRTKKKQKIVKLPGITQHDLAFIKKLRGMDADIKKELTLLRQVARHRPLYPEEKYLLSKLNQYRKILSSVGSKKA